MAPGGKAHTLTACEFVEQAFVIGSDPVVCILPASALRRWMSVREIDAAFGGHASYRQLPWMKRWVGVWGRRNCRRLRRLLRERGAEIELLRERPPHLHLTLYMTRRKRPGPRALDSTGAAAKGG